MKHHKDQHRVVEAEFGPQWNETDAEFISPVAAFAVAAVLAVPLLALANIVPPVLFALLGALEVVIALAAWRSLRRGSTHLSCMARTAVLVCAGTQLVSYAWMGCQLMGVIPAVAKPADWNPRRVQPAAQPREEAIPQMQFPLPPAPDVEVVSQPATDSDSARIQPLQWEAGPHGIPPTQVFQLRYSETLEPRP